MFNYQFIFIINKYNIFIKYIFIKILNFQKSISRNIFVKAFLNLIS